MAEEKSSPGIISDREAAERIIYILAGLVLIGAIFSSLLAYIASLGLDISKIIDYFFKYIWPIWQLIAAIVSALALAGIIHNYRKLQAINIEERKIYDPLPETTLESKEEVAEPKNEKWEKVMKYLNSDNPSDWRLAVIEADVMLEELLRTAGFVGESVGEMLKSVDKNEFLTIEDAWEAHKKRNAIAHSGGDFQLNEREAKRIIALFEKVFKEFQII